MKTGFPPGRPRKGELRPQSKSARYSKEYRLRRIEADPSYREQLAEKQARWRAENPERAREINRNTRLRRKMWMTTSAANTLMH